MAAKTLTREQGYAFQDSGQGARISVNHMTTRTAVYEWNDQTERWERTQAGLQIVHAKGTGQGFVWQARAKRFVRCTCAHCIR